MALANTIFWVYSFLMEDFSRVYIELYNENPGHAFRQFPSRTFLVISDYVSIPISLASSHPFWSGRLLPSISCTLDLHCRPQLWSSMKSQASVPQFLRIPYNLFPGHGLPRMRTGLRSGLPAGGPVSHHVSDEETSSSGSVQQIRNF